MRHARRTTGRCTLGLLLATVLAMWQAPAGADVGEPTGPVIFTSTGDWLIRNSPTGGNAERSFRYGRGSDLPVVGDWNGNGGETPGVARNTGSGTWQWHLRNSLTGGPAARNRARSRSLPYLPPALSSGMYISATVESSIL